MLCHWCDYDNLPGADLCRHCMQDMTQHDRPVARDRIERSLMDEPVGSLRLVVAVTLPPEATLRQAIAAMVENDIGSVLIVDASRKLTGIFSERDLLLKVSGGPNEMSRPIADFMTRRPETIRETDSLALALHKMDCGGYRHLPVVQESDLLGVVSVRDMLRHVSGLCRNG